MIRRRTSEPGGGVLSFTFLDVLTCTMGSLVLLLVVLAQRASDTTLEEALKNASKPQAAADAKKPKSSSNSIATAKTDATPQEVAQAESSTDSDDKPSELPEGLTPQELAKQLASLREQMPKLQELRAKAAQRALEEESRVSHLEDHERRLEHELAKLHVALARLEEAEKKQNVDQETAERELERLKQLVVDTEKEIDSLRKETVGKKSYAIVPYKGANGTMRRPIYIECTKDAVTIYPEGIKLTAADFDGPLRSGNPLAAAIRAAREELNARATAAGMTDLPDPYPLLIVRPDGAYAYGAALSAIGSWDSDFGYEFVDADWKLEYPDPDPRLDQMMRHAVEQARERQAMLAKAAPRRYGSRLLVGNGEGGDGGGGDGSGGGFEGVAHPGGSGERIGDHSGENWMQASGQGSGSGSGAGSAGGQQFVTTAIGGQGSSGGGGGGAGGAEGNFIDQQQRAAATPGAGGQGAGGEQRTASAGQIAGSGSEAAAASGATGTEAGEGAPGGTAASGSTTPTGGSTFAGANAPSAGATASGNTTAAVGSAGASAGAASGANSAASGAASSSSSGSSGSGGASGGAISYNAGQTASAAASRGANWANGAAGRRASAISRPIRVVVRPEQIDVMPTNQGGSGPLGQPTPISFHQPTDRVLDQLAASVQEQMKDWGLAGSNMYWRPTLVLQVAPGAEQHAIRLNDLLRDSGIDVKFQEVASRTEGEASHGTR